ncbi:putative cysteine-rich receptor-like protein kinase 35 [Triticum aestivum]|uniref:putative cysteine-rich receptor-like protein kinase 35 n=1 Tax=Triticum aestivum TaxID=4565 RepID=UPI001D010DDE|nr:putative cysteine-rich receptor-like protein kinase 35 [Triticum aestivum]
MVPKILDYGLSRVFSEEIRQTVLNNIDGSLAYMATPEYKTGGEITLKSDIYCLGVIIMQIVTGQSKKNYPNIASIVESWRSRLELNASKGRHTFETCYQQVQVCIEIGIRCMDDDPGKRPVTRYIVNKLDNKETKQSIRCGMVLKLEINGKRCISSFILRIASKLEGIKSMTVDEEKSTLMVVGTVDVVKLVTVLRKAKHLAHVITVGSAENVVYQSDSIDVHDQESDSCTIM